MNNGKKLAGPALRRFVSCIAAAAVILSAVLLAAPARVYAEEDDGIPDIHAGARLDEMFTALNTKRTYRFTAPSDGMLYAAISCLNVHPGSGLMISGKVSGSEGRAFADFSLPANSTNSSCAVGVGAGDYIVELACDDHSFYAEDFIFSLDFVASDTCETEFNDNIVSADKLSVGRAFSGAMNTPEDCDFFYADLSEVSDAAFRFEGKKGGSWELSVFDGNMKQLSHSVCSGRETVDLRAAGTGSCYLRVMPLEHSGKNYTVTLTGMKKTAKSRLAGNDRIATAVSISREGWENAGSVIIANGFSFPDALAGVSLAGTLDAPILLTANRDTAEQAIIDEIDRLGAKTIYILGGSAAVNESIEAQLAEKGTVERLSGSNRFETAVRIAEKLSEVSGKAPETVFFACAQNFPDALSAGPAAALKASPILYINPEDNIEDATREYISGLSTQSAVILGGTAAISETGENDIRGYFRNAERVSGKDRYETAANLYNRFKNSFSGKDLAIATGRSFPDALAGGALSARLRIPMILVGGSLGDLQKEIIMNAAPERIYVFGGSAAVNDSIVNALG